MKIYALLIGINEYAIRPLAQCVKDAGKIERYLKSLKKKNHDVEIVELLDEKATKENIVQQIRTHLGKAGDGDVALLYFSGHGALEQTGGLFPEEHDGLLDALVCYNKEGISTDQFLANKEIRYLFHQLPKNPHLVTIIDSCHSGDIVRAFEIEDEEEGAIKRIAGSFPARVYKQFVFAGDAKVEKKEGNKVKEVFIPMKNHIHVAACLSSEMSWEIKTGGVFTSYLIDLLEATKGNLSYLDIARWAKISLRGVTKKKQTPTISVQGEGPLNAELSWLNLHPDGLTFPEAQVVNTPNGWVYSRGSILGVKKGMPVIISVKKNEEITAKVKEVETDQALLELTEKEVKKLDFDTPYYPARTEETTYATLRIGIGGIDNEPGSVKAIEKILAKDAHVEVVKTGNADFVLNLFNGFAYFCLPEHDFQPLAEQIPLDNAQELERKLQAQLKAFVKWNHFYSLENPGRDFQTSPVKVSVEKSEGKWIEVTNDTYRMKAEPERQGDGLQYQKVRVKVENVSKEKLYVGVLTLNSDLSITSKPFQGKVIELGPGQSKLLYDHREPKTVVATLDMYKEVYNWKEEWFCYKFIFNNYEDFSAALNDPDYLQPALNPPLTIEKDTRDLRFQQPKGEGGEVEEVKKKWGTCRVRMELSNEYYNVISGDLKDLWEDYAASEALAPFIKELYLEDYFDGNKFEPRLKQNKNQSAEEAQRATDIWYVKLFNRIYSISRRRRFRRQKHTTGPIVIAEGDSWFLYPKPGVRDTLDYIMDHYRLLSLAEAGDEIADYIKNGDLLAAVKKEQPDYVLISGGGNDILGAQVEGILQKNVASGQKAGDYLKMDEFNKKITFLKEGYEMFFQKIMESRPGVKIFIHGYDYIRHNPDANIIKNGWANRYMIAAGIQEADRERIIRFLVDTFNEMLAGLAQKYSHVFYVNHRGTVGLMEWMDEIHPNNIGYEKVAKNFLKRMAEV